MTIRNDRSASKKRGFSLTEIAVVLGIVGIVISGIWTAVNAMHRERMISTEMADLLTIVTGIQNLYAGRAFTDGYFQDITASIVANKIIPPDLPVVGGYPLDREGGVIKVEAQSNSPAASPHAFEVEFFGTPISCHNILYAMSQQQGSMQPLYIWDGSSWRLPADVTASSFTNCTYASFAFALQ